MTSRSLPWQAQLAATTPKHGSPGGSPDRFNGEPKDSAGAENGDPSQGQHSSGSHGSPPESPEAAVAQGSFHMDESPIRGLLTDGARAAARRAERLTAAAAAREAAAAAVAAAAAAAPEAATEAVGAAPKAAAEEAGTATATGKRTGKWTPRGSGIMPAAPTAGGKKKSRSHPSSASSSSSSGSEHSLGRELERFVCGGTPEHPPPHAVAPAPPTAPSAPAHSEGCASSPTEPEEEVMLDVLYDLQGGSCPAPADEVTADSAASDAGSSSPPAHGWAAISLPAAGHNAKPAVQEIPAVARLPSASSRGRASAAATFSYSAGRSYAQLWRSVGLRSAGVGVSALGGVICVGLLLAARRRHTIVAGIRYLLGIFRLYRATLQQLR